MAPSNMKISRFISKMFVFFCVIVFSYIALLCISGYENKDSNKYVAAQLDKLENLMATPSPRIVFLGGSSLAYGLDSAMLKRALGRPVVNMGLTTGFGIRYMLDSIRPLLRQGDIVVVLPEYELFLEGGIGVSEGNAQLIDLMFVSHDLRLLKYITPSILVNANEFINFKPPPWLVKRSFSPPNSRDSFNADGDLIAHLMLPDRPSSSKRGMGKARLYPPATDQLSDFMGDCSKNGIKAVCIFSCYAKESFRVNSETIAIVENELRKRIPDLIPLSHDDYVLDDKYFYEPSHHLNSAGRALWSDRLGIILKKYLQI